MAVHRRAAVDTKAKAGAGAVAAARAVPFYDAEELSHQFEHLTAEEEGLLKVT